MSLQDYFDPDTWKALRKIIFKDPPTSGSYCTIDYPVTPMICNRTSIVEGITLEDDQQHTLQNLLSLT
jgi:hypothetical protein